MNIGQALTSLGITEWVLRGEPTTEAEFNQMFRKVTGADANGSAIAKNANKCHNFTVGYTTLSFGGSLKKSLSIVTIPTIAWFN